MNVKMVLAPINALGPFKEGLEIDDFVRNNVNDPDKIFDLGLTGTSSSGWMRFGTTFKTTDRFFNVKEFVVSDDLSDEDLMYLCHGRAFELWRENINFHADYHNCWVFADKGAGYKIIGSTY